MAMADGYACLQATLGVVNLHVAPGLGNAMGMLYDATKTDAPLLLTAGQQDGRYAFTEPILWGNLVRMVESMTKWAYQVERVEDLPAPCGAPLRLPPPRRPDPSSWRCPMDIMMAEADLDISAPPRIGPRLRGDLEPMQHAAAMLASAHIH